MTEHTIIIVMEGGIIQNIVNIPADTVIEVRDFDVEGVHESELEMIGDDECIITEWRKT